MKKKTGYTELGNYSFDIIVSRTGRKCLGERNFLKSVRLKIHDFPSSCGFIGSIYNIQYNLTFQQTGIRFFIVFDG